MKIYYGEPQGFAWLFGLALAVLSPLVPDAYHYLESFPLFAHDKALLALVFASGSLLIAGGLIALAGDFLYRFRWFRRLFDQMARLEGFWVQFTGIKGRPYSFATIEYNFAQQRYRYFGDALNHFDDTKSYGQWETCNVMFDVKDNRLIFYSEYAAVGKEDERDEVYNFGWLRPTKPGSVDQLRGEVRDFTRHAASHRPDAISFDISYMTKVPVRKVSGILGKQFPDTIQDKHKVVLATIPDAKLKEGMRLSTQDG